MRNIAAACVVLALGSTSALAQGMKDYDRPPLWTGVYVGVHGGWASGALDPLGPAPPSGAPTQDVKGGFVGGQVGAQYQWSGGLVTGIEADISLADLNKTVRDGNYITQTGTISSFGTVRGRLGLAMGNFMPFVTGGFAWDRMRQNETCPDAAAVPFGWCSTRGPYNLSKTETSHGWVWGGGFEYAINHHWSLRLEGMRLEFEDVDYNLGKMANNAQVPTKTFDHHIDVVRFGTSVKW